MKQRTDLAFPMSEYEHRLQELRVRMTKKNVDAMLVTTPENICYLTGYESPGIWYLNSLIIPMDGEPFMVPRRLEDSGVQALTWIEHSHPYEDYEHPVDKLTEIMAGYGLTNKRIGYEKQSWFFTAPQQERLFEHMNQATFIDCSMIVEQGRMVKSELEIDLMRKAALPAEAGMRAGIEATRAGATENDIAAEMTHAMIKAGSEWPAIMPFVASGYRGAIGHATWAGRTVEKGDIIMLELAGCQKRYHTALMRTGFIGEPTSNVREAEKIVLEAFDVMMDTIKPGVRASDADAAGREVIARHSEGIQGSRSAYSMGIALPPDWGEGHIISMQPGEDQPLQANMTFHLLPWIQVHGKGGISISETIRVTETGCERITDFERGIFVK